MAAALAARPGRHEHLNPEGLRADGRRQEEIRRLVCEIETADGSADGTASVGMGNTRVRASVHGPAEAARGRTHHDRAALSVEVTMAAFAAGEWTVRGRGDRMLTELGSMVEQTFDALILSHLYPGSHIAIRLRIAQVDGGVRAACINATTLALVDAGIALRDYACACSVGHVGGTLLVDVSAAEDGAGAELTVALAPKSERVLLTHLSAAMPLELLAEALALVLSGIKKVHDHLDSVVRAHMAALCTAPGGAIDG